MQESCFTKKRLSLFCLTLTFELTKMYRFSIKHEVARNLNLSEREMYEKNGVSM